MSIKLKNRNDSLFTERMKFNNDLIELRRVNEDEIRKHINEAKLIEQGPSTDDIIDNKRDSISSNAPLTDTKLKLKKFFRDNDFNDSSQNEVKSNQVSEKQLDLIRGEFDTKMQTIESKIESNLVYCEKMMSGMTDEIVTFKKSTQNKSEMLELSSLNGRIDDCFNSLTKNMQSINQLNTGSSLIMECLKLLTALMQSDEKDKESFGV